MRQMPCVHQGQRTPNCKPAQRIRKFPKYLQNSLPYKIPATGLEIANSYVIWQVQSLVKLVKRFKAIGALSIVREWLCAILVSKCYFRRGCGTFINLKHKLFYIFNFMLMV